MDKTTSQTNQQPVYKRILLKLSGEALQGASAFGADPSMLAWVSSELASVVRLGVQVGVVIGGGNFVRGSELCTAGFNRVTADQMGMMATVINGLALRDALQQQQLPSKVMSAISISGLVETFDRWQAMDALNNGYITVFVGGTGCPLVTTDSAAALRGVEIQADIVIKATKVDGVFAADPVKNPKAKRYLSLTYDEVLEQRLGIMDLNSILLCKDNALPLRVFNMNLSGALKNIVLGEDVGTLIK